MLTRVDGVPVLGICAPSGTGKTTLISTLIPLLSVQGIRVGCVKHTHHAFEIDREGKDSARMHAAGARQVLLASPTRWALVVDADEEPLPSVATLVRRLDLSALDLVLVEGYHLEDVSRIAVHRAGLGQPLPHCDPATTVALVTNLDPLPPSAVPVLDLDLPADIARFILARAADRTPPGAADDKPN